MKTNAARILDELGVGYEVREYRVQIDEKDFAESVARAIDLLPAQVFKTLVVRGDRTGIGLAVIPGNTHLDTKALARLSGNKHIDVVKLNDVQPLTGYVRGSVTALGCKKNYLVYVDGAITLFNVIGISGGVPGIELLLSPSDFLRVVNATVGSITRNKP